jgi:hypothetical protein
MGFSLHGTPREGDVIQVAAAMDDVLPNKPSPQVHVVGPKADGSLPTAADLEAKRRDLTQGQ